MDWFGILVVFVVTWWMVFLVTLPFGVTTPCAPEPGHAPSAPEKPRLWIKAGFTTLVAGALTGLAVAAVAYNIVDVRAWFEPR